MAMFGQLEVSGEIRVTPHLGVGAILGVAQTRKADSRWMGVWQQSCSGNFECSRSTLWAGGLQAFAYPVGDFDKGLRVGGQVMYVGGSSDIDYPLSAAIAQKPIQAHKANQDLTAAFLVGYKWSARPGMTFDANIGPMLGTASGLGARVTLNVGWSF